MIMSDQLLASPLPPPSPRPTQAISSIIHYPHSLWSGPGTGGTEGENKRTWRKAMVRVDYTKAWGTGRVQLPCACCLLQTTLRALPICHPEVPPKYSPPQHPPAVGAWPSQGSSTPGSLGSAGMAPCVTPAHPCKLQPHGSLMWALMWLQSRNQVWVWAGFTSSSSWAAAQLLQSPLPEPQPTQVPLLPLQLELQIARQAWQWQSSLCAFTLPSAFARSSRACEMQMLSHLRVLFNQPQMLRLIEQWFA